MKIGFKTILGAVISAAGFLAQPEVFALLPERVAAVVTAVGAVLCVVGGRHAISKHGTAVVAAASVFDAKYRNTLGS